MVAVEVLPAPQTNYYDAGSESAPSEQHDNVVLDLGDDDDDDDDYDDQDMSVEKRAEYPAGYFPPTPPQDEKLLSTDENSEAATTTAVGTGPEEFYDKALPPWRAAIRRRVMSNLRAESNWLADMQSKIRHPWLDSYFVYSSSLGTHTFFLIALPALFFFGFRDQGLGLVFALGTGVYASSFLKDLICSPRPYAPPVARLTIGSHHLEYGFPSTHSTNSISIALFIYAYVHSSYFSPEPSISTTKYAFWTFALIFYSLSIVLGRLYTGMHSITDCVAGVLLGVLVWVIHVLFWPLIEQWVVAPQAPATFAALGSWIGPVCIATLAGIMVHRHPQPAEDCPCFEDAIAFVSVIAGVLTGCWGAERAGFGKFTSHMTGSPFALLHLQDASAEEWATAVRDTTAWWGIATAKLFFGISIIFAWRILAKSVLHHLLPTTFRLLARAFALPARRFYTPATEYNGSVPMDSHGSDGVGGLRSIPSVIDLPGSFHFGEEEGWEGNGERYVGARRVKAPAINRKKALKGEKKSGWQAGSKGNEKNEGYFVGSAGRGVEDAVGDGDEFIIHYDADVITKFVVYFGIAVLATSGMPVLFHLIGWGVHP